MEILVGLFVVVWLFGWLIAKFIKPSGMSTVDYMKNYGEGSGSRSYSSYGVDDSIRMHEPLPDYADDIDIDEFIARLSNILKEDGKIIVCKSQSGKTIVADRYLSEKLLDFIDKVVIVDTINGDSKYKNYRDKIYNI